MEIIHPQENLKCGGWGVFVYTHRGERRGSGILLHHCSTYSFKSGPLIGPEARQAVSKPQRSSLPLLQSTGVPNGV